MASVVRRPLVPTKSSTEAAFDGAPQASRNKVMLVAVAAAAIALTTVWFLTLGYLLYSVIQWAIE